MTPAGRGSRWLVVALIALALVAPFFVYPVFLMEGLIWALFASAFNLLFGYAGLLSFGHAAFFGTAAYCTAFLLKQLGAPPEVAIVASVALSALLGAAFGGLALRHRGIYFAMVTLALAELIHFLAVRWPATGGENGLQGVPRGVLLSFIDLDRTRHLYFFVLAVTLAAFALVHRIVRSPFGMVLGAFRDNEQRIVSLGYQVRHHLILAMTLSAALSGLAGSLKVLVFQLAALPDVGWNTSGMVVLATLIGGTGTFLGPIVGGMVLALLQSLLAESGEWVTLILGLIFIACVHLFRDGIVGSLPRWAFWRARAAPRLDELSAGEPHREQPVAESRRSGALHGS